MAVAMVVTTAALEVVPMYVAKEVGSRDAHHNGRRDTRRDGRRDCLRNGRCSGCHDFLRDGRR